MKISILVPTYNRVDHIIKQLANFEVIFSSSDIDYEIIIGDNSTNNDTLNYVSTLENSHYIYFKNVDNIGYDSNVQKCFKAASGDYIWLIGDKNYFTRDDFFAVVNELKESPDALIVSNRQDYKIYNNVSDVIEDVGFRLSLLCTTIVRGDSVKYLEKSNKYLGYDFIHIGIIFEYLCTLDSVYVKWYPKSIFHPWTENRKSWFDKRYQIFACNWFKTIMSLPNQIGIDAKLNCLRGPINGHIFGPKSILRTRAKGGTIFLKDLKQNREFLELTSHSTYIENYLVIVIPKYFLIIPYKIYKLFKRK